MAVDDGASRTIPGESPVERAFRLLQLVAGSEEPLGVRELARRSGLPRSSVGRLVGQLERLDMVERTDDAAVVAGPGLATLQPDQASGTHLPARLRPLLHELVATFGENAALSIDDRDALLYVAQAAADHPVSVPDVSGERHLFHLVAPGLVTMAWWAPARIRAYLREPLVGATASSTTDPEQITDRLGNIREQGWCWTDQELDQGVNGLAVPVMLGDDLIATVSLFGPAYRFSPGVTGEAAETLLEIVVRRSNELLGS